jgi:N-formylglutamate deformylase
MVNHHKSDRKQELPFFITIPHSGEMVPEEATWLQSLPEVHLMRDVDRYVDKLYEPAMKRLGIPHIIADCHRYVIDLNRKPEEYDAMSVIGAKLPPGSFPKGLHWCLTTFGEPLILEPMSSDAHKHLVKNYYLPFHESIPQLASTFGQRNIYHLDAHSMPSKGTAAHNDPGEVRAEIVVSDFHGTSCRKEFVDIVIEAYKKQGFTVAYNWPYFGGGITQMYGKPKNKHHTLQVELNRKTYMNEETKQMNERFAETQKRIENALQQIIQDLSVLSASDSPSS